MEHFLSFTKEARCHIYVTEKPGKSLRSCQFLCETAVDGSSVLNPGVLGSLAGRRGGGVIFPKPQGRSGREAEADQWRQVELGMGWP